jgi:hypothetical protein
VPAQYIPQGPRAGNARGRGRGGRGRGGRDGFVVGQSKWATTPHPNTAPAADSTREVAATPAEPSAPEGVTQEDADNNPRPVDQDNPSTTDTTPATAMIPSDETSEIQTQPTATVPLGPRLPAAVRGDRSGTGGLKKAKLTESELSERLAAIRLKNASLEAAHARAEADEQNYRERETQAQIDEREKLKKERQNRQQMIGERERNAQRKLKAMGGREWDLEKTEQEEDRGGRARRGAHGGVVGERYSARAARREEPTAERGPGWGVSQEGNDQVASEGWGPKPTEGDDWNDRPRTPNPVKAWDESLPDPTSFSDPNEPQLPPDDLFGGGRVGRGRGGGRGRGEGRGGRRGSTQDDSRGGHERRGGNRGGRGNAGFDDRMSSQRKQQVPREEDFPALGGGGSAKKPLVMEKSKWATPSAPPAESQEDKKRSVEVEGDWDKPVANWADDAMGTKSTGT